MLNENDASANVFGCQILDSLRTSVLDIDAKLRHSETNSSWTYKAWKLKSEMSVSEMEIGTRGKFRHLILETSVVGNNEHLRALTVSSLQLSDSLFYIGMHLGGGSVGTLKTEWTTLVPNGLLDTVDLEYEARYKSKGAFIGSKYLRHVAEINWDFLHTRRAPFEDVHDAIRDSSEGFLGRLNYEYRGTSGTIRFWALWAHLNFTCAQDFPQTSSTFKESWTVHRKM